MLNSTLLPSLVVEEDVTNFGGEMTMKKIRGAAGVAAVLGALTLTACSASGTEYKSIDEMAQKIVSSGYVCDGVDPEDLEPSIFRGATGEYPEPYDSFGCEEDTLVRQFLVFGDEKSKDAYIDDSVAGADGLNPGRLSRADRWIVEGTNWIASVYLRDDSQEFPLEEMTRNVAEDLGGSVWPRSK
ncbi:MAG: hypothetical protein LBE25_09360 [Arthrobacter sp.]|jgi:hypothetical protein|nr:hypothetical protein [Arthrobacter sp.]